VAGAVPWGDLASGGAGSDLPPGVALSSLPATSVPSPGKRPAAAWPESALTHAAVWVAAGGAGPPAGTRVEAGKGGEAGDPSPLLLGFVTSPCPRGAPPGTGSMAALRAAALWREKEGRRGTRAVAVALTLPTGGLPVPGWAEPVGRAASLW
jgi:hypothetical protein